MADRSRAPLHRVITRLGRVHAPGRARARIPGRYRPAAAAAAMVAAVPLLTGMMVPPGSGAPGPAGPPRPAAQKPVAVYPVKPGTVKVPVMRPWHAPVVRWPAAGTATVPIKAGAARQVTAALAGPSAGSAQAGSLPVHVGPAAAARGQVAASAPSSVTVSMLPRKDAAAAGVSGVMFTLGAGQAPSARRVHVSLDYSSFAYADGGDYASRLRLVELPACVLTSPRRPACRVQAPLSSANNVRAGQLGADVTVPAAPAVPAAVRRPAAGLAASTGTVVVAATTSTSGSGGDYTATPLSEAGTWAEGGSSGAFTYSYPIQVPPVPGGLEPDVSLNYDSQLVDGLTSSTNSQASWIGDGWDYSPGYIERDYQSCELNSGSEKTGDFCQSSNDTTTLSLNGQDTTLVLDDSTGTWHAEADGNEKISYDTGTSNGTHDGGYWVITEPDGTSYYFGLNELPGYASGDTPTSSSWNMPVYATSSGQPCYNATFSLSHCYQAWRWNLDYVTGPHGDAVAYFYNTETNYYASDNGTTANAAYQQAGALSKIEYGLRAGAVYGVTPAAEVTFTTSESRTDVPTDLSCSNGASCDVVSPTFWGKYQLTSISTQALEGTSLASVDTWALSQTYPSTGDPTTPASLWLSSIARTGQDTAGGGSSASLPAVSFSGTALANRVMTQADLNSGYSIITRFRLTTITNETGGVIGVTYDTPGGACTSGNFPAPDANTGLCYPDYWTPPGASSPIEDWFNKYVVTAVTQTNTAGGGVPVQTSYCYGGSPGCLSSGAWHYDDDSLTRSTQRTWDQWRGFQTVITQTGTSPDPVTQTTDTYFQGMNGDYQSGGSTSSVSLTSSQGDTVTDSDQFAGMNFEHITYDGAGGSEVTDTITIPWTSGATATQSQPSPLPPLTSFMTGTAETKTYTALSSGGSRESDITYTHDPYGRVISESDVPDTGDASEDTCTTTTYASSTSAWILNLASEVQVVSVPCGTTPSLPADAVSDTLTFYDGATSLASDIPSKGDVTETQKATSYNGTSPVYTTQSTATYDEYGRVLTSTDADNRTTTTAYTPATGAEPTSVTVTDPADLVTTTLYDPARDLPTQVTSPAGYVTSETYDGLGRLTAVWEPGHTKGSASADETFSYSIGSSSAPSVVTTSTLNNTGGYTTSETLYDSLGREAETQTATPDGGRDITDIYYNSDGWESLESSPYYTTGAPDGTLVAAPDSQVPSQTGYVYDGDGRVVQQISYTFASETWETDTAYGGDSTTVSYKNLVAGEPTGGTPETTFTDGRGLTSKIYQYHAGVTPGPSDPASDYDVTSYTYTPAQQLATITDAAGNQWSYSYDLLGDQTSQTDPDAGTSSSTYDAAGQLMSVTDARGDTISYTYDGDGRKTGEYDTTGGAAENSGDEIASWTYDTLKKGMLTSSSSYYGGQAYTESVVGYNSYGLPTGTETIIPSAQGALAGTYETGYTYDPDTMSLATSYDAAAGGLPAETVDYGYDTAGDPVSMGSSIWSYVTTLTHTEYGQPLEYTLGPNSTAVYVTDSYDQQTQRLSGSQIVTGVNNATVDSTGYTYDNVGNVLSESDTPSGGPAQVQCFTYDYLGRLAQAWSQGTSGCSAGPSQSAEAGAAAPYWESYSYNTVNNLTGETSTPATGAATTTTDSYPAAGTAQPHAVSSVQASGPSGTATSTYGYDSDGHLTSTTGSTQDQSLSWDDAGRLSSVMVTPAGSTTPQTTSYLYDADGNLLIQEDPGSVTLYLGDEQLVLDTSTGTVSGTRYYSIGGTTIAARTSAGTVDYLIGDQQGTSLLSIDSNSGVVTRRYYDPYGTPLGTPPSSWPGDEGFTGGTADTATGLTNLGAREYSPATASFISPDPLLTPADPQDLNAYAYASDNPSTFSDPSGQMMLCGGYCGGSSTGGSSGSGGSSTGSSPGNSGGNSGGGSDLGSSGGLGSGGGGGCGYIGCGVTPLGSPPPLQAILQPVLKPAPKPVHEVITNGSPAGNTCTTADLRFDPSSACQVTPAQPGGGGFNLIGWISAHRRGLAQVGLGVGAAALTIVNAVQGGADPATDALEGADISTLAAEDGGADAGDTVGSSCGLSFTGSTKVLLASGAAIPISQLKVGDKVLATNVKTGKTQAETVSAVLLNHDKDLFNLKIRSGRRTAVIHTTRNHPFFDLTRHRWVKAGALKHGDHLRTTSGTIVTVAGGHDPADATGWMWDLTIPGGNDHDFYIDTTIAAVLVHNCDGEDSIDPRDVHGALRGAERDVNPQYIWNNPDSDMYIQNDGQIVKALSNGDGSYSVVIRDMANPSGEPTTVMGNYLEEEIERNLESGYWE
jgi:RHS repeat-associated protein